MCTRGTAAWIEVYDHQVREVWVSSNFVVVSQRPHPPNTDCVASTGALFVVGIEPDGPDGGLVLRSGPGIETTRLGVLPPAYAWLHGTGACSKDGSGRTWLGVVDNIYGSGWVSGNYVRNAELACLVHRANRGPAWIQSELGLAVSLGNAVAFHRPLGGGERYSVVPADAVVFGVACDGPLRPMIVCNPGPCSSYRTPPLASSPLRPRSAHGGWCGTAYL